MGRKGISPAVSPQREARPPRRKPGAGRRRDPTIDDRLQQAARMLYAREGWAGFHFDGVVKAAGVSKDAVYRRYPDAQTAAARRACPIRPFPCLPTTPIEEALIAYASDVFAYFASGNGYANLRVHIDAARYPDVLREYRIRVIEPQISQAVGVLERARGERPNPRRHVEHGRGRGARRGGHGLRVAGRPWRGEVDEAA